MTDTYAGVPAYVPGGSCDHLGRRDVELEAVVVVHMNEEVVLTSVPLASQNAKYEG